jgi:hypothetical protein
MALGDSARGLQFSCGPRERATGTELDSQIGLEPAPMAKHQPPHGCDRRRDTGSRELRRRDQQLLAPLLRARVGEQKGADCPAALQSGRRRHQILWDPAVVALLHQAN